MKSGMQMLGGRILMLGGVSVSETVQAVMFQASSETVQQMNSTMDISFVGDSSSTLQMKRGDKDDEALRFTTFFGMLQKKLERPGIEAGKPLRKEETRVQHAWDMQDMTIQVMLVLKEMQRHPYLDEVAQTYKAELIQDRKQTTVARFQPSEERIMGARSAGGGAEFRSLRSTLFGKTNPWRANNGMKPWKDLEEGFGPKDIEDEEQQGERAAAYVNKFALKRIADPERMKRDKSEQYENEHFLVRALSDGSQGTAETNALQRFAKPMLTYIDGLSEDAKNAGVTDANGGRATEAFSAVSDMTRLLQPLGVFKYRCIKRNKGVTSQASAEAGGGASPAKTANQAKAQGVCNYAIFRHPRNSPVEKSDQRDAALFDKLKGMNLIKAEKFELTKYEMSRRGSSSALKAKVKNAAKLHKPDLAAAKVLDAAETAVRQAKAEMGLAEELGNKKADFNSSPERRKQFTVDQESMSNDLRVRSNRLLNTLAKDLKFMADQKCNEVVFAGTVISADFAPSYKYYEDFAELLGERKTEVIMQTAREYASKKLKMKMSNQALPKPKAVPDEPSYVESGNIMRLKVLQKRYGPIAVHVALEDLHFDKYFAQASERTSGLPGGQDGANGDNYPKAVMASTHMTTYRYKTYPGASAALTPEEETSGWPLKSALSVITLLSGEDGTNVPVMPIGAIMPGIHDVDVSYLQPVTHFYTPDGKNPWPMKSKSSKLPAAKTEKRTDVEPELTEEQRREKKLSDARAAAAEARTR